MNLSTLRSLTNRKTDGSNKHRIVTITETDKNGNEVTRKVMKPRDRSKYTPGGPNDKGTR